MATANIIINLNPVENPSVLKDYTFSVPIFQKKSLSSDNNYTSLGAPY